jgi:hypothetical protein
MLTRVFKPGTHEYQAAMLITSQMNSPGGVKDIHFKTKEHILESVNLTLINAARKKYRDALLKKPLSNQI